MTFLSQVKKGVQMIPPRIVMYGAPGVGKTTFASQAPSPIFLTPDDGAELVDCERFPTPKDWNEFKQQLDELLIYEHDYNTVVIDTLNAMASLAVQHFVAEKRVTVEQYDGGYGKGNRSRSLLADG